MQTYLSLEYNPLIIEYRTAANKGIPKTFIDVIITSEMQPSTSQDIIFDIPDIIDPKL